MLTQSQQVGWHESDMAGYLSKLNSIVEQKASKKPLIGRKKAAVSRRKDEIYQLSGLKMHQLPLCGNIAYDGTEDILEYRGLGKRNKSGLVRQDL